MRGHCFVNGVEKHVKCAYVGVNGKAQYIMKPPGVIKLGYAIEKLSTARYNLAAGDVNDCALFGGGSGSDGVSSTVDTYTHNLVKTTAANLSEAKGRLAVAYCMDNQLLFGGGKTGKDNGISSTVDVYDPVSLTKTTTSNLSEARYGLASSIVYYTVLFGGGLGSDYSSTVDAYYYNREYD